MRMTRPVPPVKERALTGEDIALLSDFGISGIFVMNYRRYEIIKGFNQES